MHTLLWLCFLFFSSNMLLHNKCKLLTATPLMSLWWHFYEQQLFWNTCKSHSSICFGWLSSSDKTQLHKAIRESELQATSKISEGRTTTPCNDLDRQVVLYWLILLAGDVETNPGPGELSLWLVFV